MRSNNLGNTRARQRKAAHKLAVARIDGSQFKCPKCGHTPLAWNMQKSKRDPLERFCLFSCQQCGLTDTVALRGTAFEPIDFYNTLTDNFNIALHSQRVVALKTQPLLENST